MKIHSSLIYPKFPRNFRPSWIFSFFICH